VTYHRMHAIITAMTFADRVCADGFVATSHGYYGHGKKLNGRDVKAGMLLADIGPIAHEDDCAHFVSNCVGKTHCELEVGSTKVTFRGGGLNLESLTFIRGVYGQTSVGPLAAALIRVGAKIVFPQFRPTNYATTRQAILENLAAGDVLIYASKNNHDSYEHSAILVAPQNICCHTHSRRAQDYNAVHFPWVTLLKLP